MLWKSCVLNTNNPWNLLGLLLRKAKLPYCYSVSLPQLKSLELLYFCWRNNVPFLFLAFSIFPILFTCSCCYDNLHTLVLSPFNFSLLPVRILQMFLLLTLAKKNMKKSLCFLRWVVKGSPNSSTNGRICMLLYNTQSGLFFKTMVFIK